MANIKKKIINIWDGGIKTSSRSSNPDTSDGCQMCKHFEVFKDPKKLIPMQSWTSFALDSEKPYGIRALGGASDTIYGLGSAISNWYGKDWLYRMRVDINSQKHLAGGYPIYLDMSLLPQDVWDNTNTDFSDLRITTSDKTTTVPCYVENLDRDLQTGQLWIDDSVVSEGNPTYNTQQDFNGTGSIAEIERVGRFAIATQITLTGQTFNQLAFNIYKIGSPGDLTVHLYTESGGNPGVLVETLGTLDKDLVSTSVSEQYIGFSNKTYTGSYVLVFTTDSADNDNKYQIPYTNTGTTYLWYATNSALTGWATYDATATPNFEVRYFTNTQVPEKYFYLYYGNPDANVIPYGIPSYDYTGGGRNIFSNFDYSWTFPDSSENRRDVDEEFTTTLNYVDAFFGRGIQTNSVTKTTLASDNIYISGNSFSLSFMLFVPAYPSTTTTLFSTIQGEAYVKLNNAGKLLFMADGVVNNTENTSTLSVPLNKWVMIDCSFNDDGYIYIDNIKETFNIDDGAFDNLTTSNGVTINTGSCKIAQLWGTGTLITDNQVKTKYSNFFANSSWWTFSAQEDFVNPTYDGVQLYYKLISSGDWKEYLESERPVKNLIYYPVNGFISDGADYFIVSQQAENQGFLFLSMKDPFTIVDITHLTLGVLTSNSSKIVIRPDLPINGTQYFNYGSSSLASVGDPGSASAFTAVSIIQSIAPWRTYLAIGSNRTNRGYINIWDLASSLSTEKVDVGGGNLRIVGNASDILFCVVDNFIDDTIKSSSNPTMELKQYVGNGMMETKVLMEIPAVIDDSTYADDWERAVSGFKIRRNTQTLFYARLPKDATGTTFNEGFWAVGKNSRGELALTFQIDTEGLGMPEQIHGFAQQVFFVQKDGGIYRLSDATYSNTSLYTTLKMNEGNTQISKKLHGIEVVTEPLEAGQTISVYYKTDADATRIKIFDFTGTGEITYETTYDTNGDNLKEYKEIEFDIESTGGKSAILELNYKYEYLNDVV